MEWESPNPTLSHSWFGTFLCVSPPLQSGESLTRERESKREREREKNKWNMQMRLFASTFVHGGYLFSSPDLAPQKSSLCRQTALLLRNSLGAIFSSFLSVFTTKKNPISLQRKTKNVRNAAVLRDLIQTGTELYGIMSPQSWMLYSSTSK